MGEADFQRIAEHNATFLQLVALAEDHMDKGRYEVSAVYAQIAAKYAAGQHPGVFASSRLEHLLYRIGCYLSLQTSPAAMPIDRTATPTHVLHVFTQAAGIGGHTRMAWRWIASDSDRTHSIAITRQGFAEVPAQLKQAVEQTQGSVHVIDRKPGGLIALAKRLRNIAQSSDLVMLHIDPDDVVPIIALADPSLALPVVFVNHADQLFCLGVSVTDVIANLRHTGQLLATSRRGLAVERCALLPIPIVLDPRTLSRPEAKRKLGLPDDSVLLLSVARPHKYASINGVSFIDSLLPIVERFPNVHVLVIGPGEDVAWAQAHQRTSGRLRTLGLRWDMSTYYQAADIYVDSYPVVSITSLLEAGSHGLPLVSRYPDGDGTTVLSADTPALTRHMLGASSVDEFHNHLARLITDADVRLDLGAVIKRDIEEIHTGAGWKRALDTLYRLSSAVSHVGVPEITPDHFRTETVDVLLPRMFPREPDLDQVLQFNVRLFPLHLRTRLWTRMVISNHVFRPGLLLPQSTATRLEMWRSSRSTRRRFHGIKRLIPIMGKLEGR